MENKTTNNEIMDNEYPNLTPQEILSAHARYGKLDEDEYLVKEGDDIIVKKKGKTEDEFIVKEGPETEDERCLLDLISSKKNDNREDISSLLDVRDIKEDYEEDYKEARFISANDVASIDLAGGFDSFMSTNINEYEKIRITTEFGMQADLVDKINCNLTFIKLFNLFLVSNINAKIKNIELSLDAAGIEDMYVILTDYPCYKIKIKELLKYGILTFVSANDCGIDGQLTMPILQYRGIVANINEEEIEYVLEELGTEI